MRYARWDLRTVTLVDRYTNTALSLLYPQDKSANADGMRRAFIQQGDNETNSSPITATGIAPLLKRLMAEFAATGLPSPYIPKGDDHE